MHRPHTGMVVAGRSSSTFLNSTPRVVDGGSVPSMVGRDPCATPDGAVVVARRLRLLSRCLLGAVRFPRRGEPARRHRPGEAPPPVPSFFVIFAPSWWKVAHATKVTLPVLEPPLDRPPPTAGPRFATTNARRSRRKARRTRTATERRPGAPGRRLPPAANAITAKNKHRIGPELTFGQDKRCRLRLLAKTAVLRKNHVSP